MRFLCLGLLCVLLGCSSVSSVADSGGAQSLTDGQGEQVTPSDNEDIAPFLPVGP